MMGAKVETSSSIGGLWGLTKLLFTEHEVDLDNEMGTSDRNRRHHNNGAAEEQRAAKQEATAIPPAERAALFLQLAQEAKARAAEGWCGAGRV